MTEMSQQKTDRNVSAKKAASSYHW